MPDLPTWWATPTPDPVLREQVHTQWDAALAHARDGDSLIPPAEYHITRADGSPYIWKFPACCWAMPSWS